MNVRPLHKRDIKRCVEICDLNYGHKYHNSINIELHRMFDKTFYVKPTYYVYEENDTIHAFAGYCLTGFDYNVFGLFWVNTHPASRKQNYATKVVKQIIHSIKQKLVDTNRPGVILLTCEKPLEIFYNRFAFKTVETTGTELIMSLKLNQPAIEKPSPRYAPAYESFSFVTKRKHPDIPYPRFKFDTIELECFYCTCELTSEKRTKDHVHPKRLGGKKIEGNWVFACKDCNILKSDSTVIGFKAILEDKMEKANGQHTKEYLNRVYEKVIFMISKLYPNVETKE